MKYLDNNSKCGGTLQYMAPELIFTKEANPHSSDDPRAVDYWSLGCVIYELITEG